MQADLELAHPLEVRVGIDGVLDLQLAVDIKGRVTPQTLTEVGLKPVRETFKNPIMLRWNSQPGLAEVSESKRLRTLEDENRRLI